MRSAQCGPIEPGDLAGLWRGRVGLSPEQDTRPALYLVAQSGLDWIGEHVQESVGQRVVVEDRLRRVTSLEYDSTSFSDMVDGAREIAKEVAGPCGEPTARIVYEQVEVVGHGAHGEEVNIGKRVLCPADPLENGLIEPGIGSQEESCLMAASRDEIVRAWFVSPQWSRIRRSMGLFGQQPRHQRVAG